PMLTWRPRWAIGRPDTGPQVSGMTVVVVGYEEGRTVRIWDLATQQPIGDLMSGQEDQVSALALGELKDRPIAVTGDQDKTVRIWDLTSQQPIGSPMIGGAAVSALALGELKGK